LRDQLGDRLVDIERIAEIAVQHVAEPDQELRRQRPGQAELLADARDVFVGRVVAGDDGGRVTGGQAQDQEDDQRHHQQHRHDGEETLGQEAQHRPALRPRISSS
jgi:hypothetical protein